MQQMMKMKKSMPDIAKESSSKNGMLYWVGMKHVEMPVFIDESQEGLFRIPARFDIFVNLTQQDVKGIHMSRLYLLLNKAMEQPVTLNGLKRLLEDFISSHADISNSAKIHFSFEYMVRRKALVSENSGWRIYPIEVFCLKTPQSCVFEIAAEVLYSSTCPCSAALARQLIQENFTDKFSNKELHFDEIHRFLGSQEGINATPHSQRSYAKLKIKLSDKAEDLYFMKLINLVEKVLKTPVQAAVKREDEQAFAKLNGENLMFCEDAGRMIHEALENQPEIADFWAEVSHVESLHPHDAVSITAKGIEGGYPG